MFDRRLLWTGVALAVTAGISLLFVNLSGNGGAVLSQENVSYVEKQPAGGNDAPVPDDKGYAYILKSYEGRVAVFIPGSEEPEIVYDKLVKFLPDYDRILMEKGIPIRDFEALVSIIEDYIS